MFGVVRQTPHSQSSRKCWGGHKVNTPQIWPPTTECGGSQMWLAVLFSSYTQMWRKKSRLLFSPSLRLTLRGLQCFLTYLPEELCTSQSSLDRWTYRRFLWGTQLTTFTITISWTRCSPVFRWPSFLPCLCFFHSNVYVNIPISGPPTWFSPAAVWE